MQVYGQLQNASLEVLSADPSSVAQGRIWFNSTALKLMSDDGTNKRALLRNDQNCVFGNSGTPANNIRFHRAANALLQFVTADDTSAAGVLATSLAQISAKFETYTLAGKPAPGNPGRLIYITDNTSLYLDTGSAFLPVVFSTGAAITGAMMANQTVTATQIAANTITSGQIAAGTITTTQIAANTITRQNLAAVGYQVSNSCGTYTVVAGGGGFTAVTNLSVPLTTTGRPVMVGLQGDRGASSGCITTTGSIDVQFYSNGSQIQFYNIVGNMTLPPSALQFVDTPSAGVHSYTVSARLNTGVATFNNCTLFAYEL